MKGIGCCYYGEFYFGTSLLASLATKAGTDLLREMFFRSWLLRVGSSFLEMATGVLGFCRKSQTNGIESHPFLIGGNLAQDLVINLPGT